MRRRTILVLALCGLVSGALCSTPGDRDSDGACDNRDEDECLARDCCFSPCAKRCVAEDAIPRDEAGCRPDDWVCGSRDSGAESTPTVGSLLWFAMSGLVGALFLIAQLQVVALDTRGW